MQKTLSFFSHILFYGFFILLSFISCKTSKIEAPAELYSEKSLEPQISTLNIPIEVNIITVEKMLNNSLKGLLYEDNNFDDDNLMFKAWKIRDFTVRCHDNAFMYSVPLKLWIKAGWKVNTLGINLSDSKEFDAEIQLNFKTVASINEKWEIVSKTTIESYEWISTPTVKIAGFNLPITTIANVLISNYKQTIHKEIDDAIKKFAPLRQYAQSMWQQVQVPFEISKDYRTSLKLSPVEVSATGISCSANKVSMIVGLKLHAETYTGKIQNTGKINTILPPYKTIASADRNFNINMVAQIDYATLDSMAKIHLVGQNFSYENRQVSITDLDFYGNEDQLVVAVKLKGSFNGRVYLAGTPYYEKETKTIKLRNLDFDFKTRNVLFTSAKWLVKGPFKNMIASKMTFPVSNYLEQAKNSLRPYLSSVKIYDEIALQCSLQDIGIHDIALMKEGLKIALYCNGSLNLNVGK